ncbi:hypothetical protein ACPWSR_07645 [Alloiococcus sp. CFN-8]|uniref:hypothetical protein n=1 Tax=Alloiococcus sp. CFN-8 TaxID=3416081 RepID=UPI003CEA7C83
MSFYVNIYTPESNTSKKVTDTEPATNNVAQAINTFFTVSLVPKLLSSDTITRNNTQKRQ